MIFRIFICVGFLAIVAIFKYYDWTFASENTQGILSLEFADASKGKQILASWPGVDLLTTARSLIWLDFVFIFFYVAIIITLSNRQVRKEPSIAINALLRGIFSLQLWRDYLM